MTKISKTPWEVDFRKDEHGHECPILMDAHGKSIADTFNADLIVIMSEYDEDGGRSWDEQGRANFEFIAKAVNERQSLLTALKLARDYMSGCLGNPTWEGDNPYPVIDAALAKAEGSLT